MTKQKHTQPKVDRRKSMSEKKAAKMAVTFELKDDGTAVATAKPVDAMGLGPAKLPDDASHPAWASDNPAVTVTEDTTDPSGLTAKVAPSSPPSLVTGAHLSITSTVASSGATLSGTSDPIDVVPGAASGFAIAEQ